MNCITPKQVRIVQIARGKVAKLAAAHGHEFGEAEYQTTLRNCDVKPDHAGRCSSKSLTQSGFEKFMAIMESMGYREPGGAEDHWRQRNSRVSGYASSRQVMQIRELARDCRYPLASMCLRVSNNTHNTPENLTPKQAYALIEALKDVAKREEQPA